MDKPMNLEEILQDLYDSEINVAISWLWDGGIDVGLGDELNGYDADGQVRTVAEAAAWLRDEACRLYPEVICARCQIGDGEVAVFIGGGSHLNASGGVLHRNIRLRHHRARRIGDRPV